MIDVSVLLLFHSRPDHFSKVWAEVKRAQPSRLFLYQDGPRMVSCDGNPVENVTDSKDWSGILACRELVSDDNIDWDCNVYRNYQSINVGCDPSEYLSQRWAFSLTDKCIVLEDDDVPSQSFFPFCKELLDKYENDERVTMIAGLNVSHEHPNSESCESYFFSRVFSIWGWASWARVVNNWDGEYDFVKDPVQLEQLKEKTSKYRQKNDSVQICINHAQSGIPYYESIFWAYMMLHDGLAIIPSVNLINNIGFEEGAHYSTQLELMPKRLRWMFEMPRHEIVFPLVHPKSVEEDCGRYQEKFYLLHAWNHPWRKVQYSMEELWLNLRRGNLKKIFAAAQLRIRKLLKIH